MNIISIQIHLQQYGNDFKWMYVTHGVFLQNVLYCWIKENCASVIYDSLRSLRLVQLPLAAHHQIHQGL